VTLPVDSGVKEAQPTHKPSFKERILSLRDKEGK